VAIVVSAHLSRVRHQCSPGAGWATAVRIDSVPGPSIHPWVTFDSGGNALAVWEQSDGTSCHIWSDTLPAGTTVWHGSTQIETNAGISGSPQICADGHIEDPDGKLYALCTTTCLLFPTA
jgi:hypothetical protein